MVRAEFISEENLKRKYKIKNGKIVILKIEDDFDEVTFWDEQNIQLGNDRDFLFIEDEYNENRYLLARMYVPIIQNGLGRAAIEFFTEHTDAVVYAREHDGNTRDDGSHLTGDAPMFVGKMQKEGLIEKAII